MPNMSFQGQVSGGGRSHQFSVTETGDVGVDIQPAAAIAAAKEGQLTTRTDANTGTLTMDPGHGIVTAQKISIFWTGGCRVDVTVGTVATNSVPFDLGSGDDLPANLTDVTVCVTAQSRVAAFDGDEAVGWSAYMSGAAGAVEFLEADGTYISHVALTANIAAYFSDSMGMTNILASADVGLVRFTHGDSTASRSADGYILHNDS